MSIPRTLGEIRKAARMPADLIDLGHGVFARIISEQWPKTDTRHIGRRARQDIDHDCDGRCEQRTTIAAWVEDANGNGVVGDPGDEVRGKVVGSELLDAECDFDFDASHDGRVAVAEWMNRL